MKSSRCWLNADLSTTPPAPRHRHEGPGAPSGVPMLMISTVIRSATRLLKKSGRLAVTRAKNVPGLGVGADAAGRGTTWR